MANKPLQSIQFPGLPDKYTVPQMDSTFAGVTGQIPDSKKVKDEISELNTHLSDTDSELADIRTGADSTVYASAGDAVRGQIENLQTALDNQTDSKEIEFSDGQYIKTGGIGVGNVVDLTPVSNANFKSSIVSVNSGDKIILNGAGGGNARLWAFIDADNKLISLSNADVRETDLILTAPQNATKLIVNINTISTVISYFGYCAILTTRSELNKIGAHLSAIDEEIDEIHEETTSTLKPEVFWEHGKLSSTGNTSGSSRTDCIRTNNFILIPTDKFKIEVPNGITIHCLEYSSNVSSSFIQDYSAITSTSVLSITSGHYIKYWAEYGTNVDISIETGKTIVVSYDTKISDSVESINEAFNYSIRSDYSTMAIFQTFGALGDSFASGGTAGGYDRSWPQILARLTGATATNYSASGRATNEWLADPDYGLAKMLSDDPLQLYMVNFGINDNTRIEAGTMVLGTIADINKSDPSQNADSFYGYYGKIISNIIDHAPNAKIVLMSVARLAERVMDDAIEEIAELFELPYMYLPNDPYFTSAEYYYSISNGHPCAFGYGGMAMAINRLMVNLMYDYGEYFRDFGV